MDTLWSQLQARDIEVEETEIPLEEFEHLFGNEVAACPAGD